jgi:hypothetical protein
MRPRKPTVSRAEPEVRIHSSPAASQQRTVPTVGYVAEMDADAEARARPRNAWPANRAADLAGSGLSLRRSGYGCCCAVRCDAQR